MSTEPKPPRPSGHPPSSPTESSSYEDIDATSPAQAHLFEAAIVAEGPAGHRRRLRERFRRGGADAMPDYELLEMVLFAAIKMGDTKPLAKRLIAAFGTFEGVIGAPENRLKDIDGVGERVVDEIKLVRAAALRMLKQQVISRPILGSWAELIGYLTAAQAHEDKEQFRILFLDRKNRLIADEVQQTGTVDHTPVYVREVIKRALELSASAILLVHNHPSGDPTPSRADIDMTQQVMVACKPLGLVVHDHVIIARHGHVSLKAQRLM